MSKGRFALGAVIGAAAGIVAGILTAPKAGKETRANLREKAAELKGQATHRADAARDRAQAVKAEAKEKAEGYKERSERAVDDAKKAFQKNNGA